MNTSLLRPNALSAPTRRRALAALLAACALPTCALSACATSEPVVGQPVATTDGGGAPSDGIAADGGPSGALDTGASPDATLTADVPPAGDTTRGPRPAADVVAPRRSTASLVVHEWGTFTSVQASDGTTLFGLHHEEEALPPFVYGRAEAAMMKMKAMEQLPEPCNQKMETPVVYFHTEAPVDVTLKVDFPQGVISQWFPAAAHFAPEAGAFKDAGKPGQAPMQLAHGSMTWQVLVDPALPMSAAPKVTPDSIWQPSRNTTAAPLRYTGPAQYNPNNTVTETERFLFYRGLGRFTLPVRVTAAEGGALTLHNDAPDAIPHAVLLHTTEAGLGAVSVHGALAAHTSAPAKVPTSFLPKLEATQAAKSALKQGLVAAGLFADEAQAMVDTWQKSWFATPGVRLLYVLPQPWTETLLPMSVQPKPAGTVRVLVGRIEVLTPEMEQDAVAKVQTAAVQGSMKPLAGIDRFREPKVRRACALLGVKVADFCAKAVETLAKQP